MSKSILIIESKGDKLFLEALIGFMRLEDIEFSNPICKIDGYLCLGGKDNLKKELRELKTEVAKGEVVRIGVILDADKEGIPAKIQTINEILVALQFSIQLAQSNEWANYEDEASGNTISISCHILNFGGYGELETVLRAIKSEKSVFANCLESWKDCLHANGETITQKEFDKFWVNIYQRYDCCSKDEKTQAGKHCSDEASMKKPIWNFEHEALTELRAYLASFT